MYVLLQGRKATTKWIKVPSCVDLKGNEETDVMADPDVRKHRVWQNGEARMKKAHHTPTKTLHITTHEKTKSG